MIKKFFSYWKANAKEALDVKENMALVVSVFLFIGSSVFKRMNWTNFWEGERIVGAVELFAIGLACFWGFLWMPFKRQEEMRNAHMEELKNLAKTSEKPKIAIETLLLPVRVLDGFQPNTFSPRTKNQEMFHVKVRNQSTFPVNIDAIGFTIKDRLLRGNFIIPSVDSETLPVRLDARSSIVAQFWTVETTGPNDLSEIDGVYVETGCGNSFIIHDECFHKWNKTADLKTLDNE